jgi:hypothetical protein
MWKVNRRRMPCDGKSSHCLWQGELIKTPLTLNVALKCTNDPKSVIKTPMTLNVSSGFKWNYYFMMNVHNIYTIFISVLLHDECTQHIPSLYLTYFMMNVHNIYTIFISDLLHDECTQHIYHLYIWPAMSLLTYICI